MTVTSPKIFGNMRNDAEFMPIISNASICWVVRIVPSSEAMLEPTFPESIKHMMEDENSKSMISRVTYPETHNGIQALWILSFIWMQITAPMKKDMSRTIAIELSPNCIISFRYCLKNIRILSGREKTRPIKTGTGRTHVEIWLYTYWLSD